MIIDSDFVKELYNRDNYDWCYRDLFYVAFLHGRRY